MDISFRHHAYKEAKYSNEVATEIFVISQLIGGLQVERGLSVSHLSGASVYSKLQEQRKANDEILLKIKSNNILKIDSNELDKFLNESRANIDSETIKIGEVVTGYTKKIFMIISLYEEVKRNVNNQKLNQILTNLINLEAARENGGKLRAKISGILAKNQSIESEALLDVMALYQGTESTLKNRNNDFSEKSQNMITTMLSGGEWRRVTETIVVILANFKHGQYNLSAEEYFTTISRALNHLQDGIKQELVVLKNQSTNIESASLRTMTTEGILIVVSILFVAFFALYQANNISKMLAFITNELRSRIDLLDDNSKNLNSRSSILSAASNEQSASLTQTATALEEVTSMIARTTSAVDLSVKNSKESLGLTQNGVQNIEEMKQAIDSIKKSMEEIHLQVQHGQDDVKLMGKLIQEIEAKTSVINDIVFQTKLLSFNASVEASRAGEHGKGFSVVAEEVGRLAQMSGEQAKEISKIIKESVEKIDEIVASTDKRLEVISEASEKSVKLGIEKSLYCADVLSSIMNQVMEVDRQLLEVDSASKEQLRGIDEIRQAVGELDKTTLQNSQVALEVKDSSTELRDVSEVVSKRVFELKGLTDGEV